MHTSTVCLQRKERAQTRQAYEAQLRAQIVRQWSHAEKRTALLPVVSWLSKPTEEYDRDIQAATLASGAVDEAVTSVLANPGPAALNWVKMVSPMAKSSIAFLEVVVVSCIDLTSQYDCE